MATGARLGNLCNVRAVLAVGGGLNTGKFLQGETLKGKNLEAVLKVGEKTLKPAGAGVAVCNKNGEWWPSMRVTVEVTRKHHLAPKAPKKFLRSIFPMHGKSLKIRGEILQKSLKTGEKP